MNLCLVCNQTKALIFGRSSMSLLFIFGIGFKGYATNATSSVILSRWSFFEGNSKDGEPNFSHHVWEIIGITLYAITLLYLQCYQWFMPERIFFSFILFYPSIAIQWMIQVARARSETIMVRMVCPLCLFMHESL